jgi:ABC-2 type transport system ATP-binding protein
VISCQLIYKSYSTGFLQRTAKIALNGISFQVDRNEIFGIIGLNGAGKSTLLKILMGFIQPDSGSALIGGKWAGTAGNHRLIGYLPEHPSLYSNLTITEHLQFASRLGDLTAKQEKMRLQAVLEQVDLKTSANIPIKRFSKGMTQRAALAYAILLEPEILILDEPMSGLDPLGRQLVIDIIHEYRRKGSTILFCSHILTDIERICDRIGIMHQGNLTTIEKNLFSAYDNKTFQSQVGKSPLESYFLETVQAKSP